MTSISRRLSISYSRVRTICRNNIIDPMIAFQKRKKVGAFKKLHKRARQRIEECLDTAESAVSIPDI